MNHFSALVVVAWLCALLRLSCMAGTPPVTKEDARGLVQRGMTAALNRFINLFTDTTSVPCKCGVSLATEPTEAAEDNSTETDGEARVVGGVRSQRFEFPWHVGLVPALGVMPFCGGSLISDRWVLTAAHCVSRRRPALTQVLLRAHSPLSPRSLRLPIESVTLHPDYVADSYSHDLALVQLMVPLPLDEMGGAVAPICLPELAEDPTVASGTTAGWGALFMGSPQSPVLRKVTLPLVSDLECNATVAGRLDSSMLCAGGRYLSGTCRGDSGGSLMTKNSEGRYQVIGVASWAWACTTLGHPSVFAKVSEMTDWIQHTTAGSRYCGA